VFATATGGFLVRARIKDPTCDKTIEIKKTLATKTPLEAHLWLEGEIDRIKSGIASPQPAKLRFSDFAVQLLEDKLAIGEIKSSAGHTRWTCTVEHLIKGTSSEEGDLYVPGVGDFFVDKLHASHVEQWSLGSPDSSRPATTPRRPPTDGSRSCESSCERPNARLTSHAWQRRT